MQIQTFPLDGVLLIQPKVFRDPRGFFLESYNERNLAEHLGLNTRFVQDNHSRSSAGVLRGLHYQLSPHAQGKLVRVVSGAIFDVAVDIRPSSPTFGRWVGATLDDTNLSMMWVPAGFAHGFLTLSERADVLYKTTDYYSPAHERAIRWDDPDIGISWPLQQVAPQALATSDGVTLPLLSSKDAVAPFLSQASLGSVA